MTPWITFYTPTYKRPRGLAACLASVARQSAVSVIEQIVIPDHVGIGIDGMYAQIPNYVSAVHGQYVHLLADDDELADPDVVANLWRFIDVHGQPPLVLVAVQKGPLHLGNPAWPPVMGGIDLGQLVIRADIWKRHVHDYGKRYEGDFDLADALAREGIVPVYCPLLFLRGGQSHGAAEMVEVPTHVFGGVDQ